jgi:hypothetical protein
MRLKWHFNKFNFVTYLQHSPNPKFFFPLFHSSFNPPPTSFLPTSLHAPAVPFTQNWGHAGLQSFSQYLPTTAAVSVSSRAAALLHSAIGLA